MKNIKLKLLITGSILLFLGITSFTYSVFIYSQFDSLTAVESKSIDLTQGNVIDEKFKTEAAGKYWIELSFERDDDLKLLECKIDMNSDPEFCNEAEPILDVSWHINGNDATLFQGESTDYTDGKYSKRVIKTLGFFYASQSSEYELFMMINKDASDLNDLNPQLSIAVSPMTYQSDIFTSTIALYFAIFCFSLGIISISIILFLR